MKVKGSFFGTKRQFFEV